LLARARENLRQLRLGRIRLKHADGNLGLPEAAPFDTIVVAAASPHVPQSLCEQLAPGGRMVLPLGSVDQVLCLIERGPEGVVERHYDPVRFVPMLAGVE
jgi:protein-L-isoaspartate(D-aspartate) O-methyltransferase